MSHKVIAIDGPAGSGKSTTARIAAARLGFVYLDTGAMYRSITYLALRQRIALSDEERLAELAKCTVIRFSIRDGIQLTLANGEDITAEIRSAEVTASVSEVSAHPAVRRILVQQQQQYGASADLVVEGRDTTSVVFPHAFLKVYLAADVEERAKRRVKDFEKLGKGTALEEQIEDIKRRDKYDSSRSASPLTCTPDSVIVDTTNLTIEQQSERIIELYRERASR
ncbi:MAG: (d)CMP kinase [Candidatus Zixiibacteriota bacterium]